MTTSHEMTSSDAGGVGAKYGFLYQDYVAANFIIQMLRDKRIRGVRCEVTDDFDILFDDHIEYVQVKSTEGEGKWTVTELCDVSKVKQGKKTVKKTDSILHKSLDCDRNVARASFRLVTQRDVRSTFSYLTIDIEKRSDKDGRDELLKSLRNQIRDYRSPKGADVEYWVDNATWQVIPSIEQIKSRCQLSILQIAEDFNIRLDSSRDPESILNDIMMHITEKGALSRKISCAPDKTIMRNDLVNWFKDEIEYRASTLAFKKVYVPGNKNNPVLVRFADFLHLQNKGLGVEQGYQLGQYRFGYIAQALKAWLPEILLRPSEMADLTSHKLIEISKLMGRRYFEQATEFEEFLAKALLHATVRHFEKSQPIPATLYIERADSFSTFDSVHIIPLSNEPDELWLGFAKIVERGKVDFAIQSFCDKLEELLATDFSTKTAKILDVKEDGYLLSHDVNEMLAPEAALDEYIHRFKFVLFLGYQSDHITPILPRGKVHKDLHESLIDEAERKFRNVFDQLGAGSSRLADLSIQVYLYPIPCLQTLLETLSKELKSDFVVGDK